MMRPKFNYLRSEKLRKKVASLDCQLCGASGPSQCSHSNQAIHGKGRSIKASDEFTAALCSRCHEMVDSSYSLSGEAREALWNEAYRNTQQTLRALEVMA